ncbi:YtxH domain-containing protein [Lactococcus protaetiae]|uniref:YtxH domain-containing protein n=1 Tax=Lactococcus protaetiae TaxID=2592653 RepID=A0A514Z890_9LACT|nr:YtxH domain-containing protein [Lactococcus protaetiae]MCL2114500.1 YtxH domain-containing protein [Streptococcaceae bacterium]QDK70795.1 YtxH domain-containing protein [Lactococcus protaetiae]
MSKKSGFLVGALVGAAAALFLAPKKGSELREDAGKIYDDFKENPQETLNNLKDSAVDFSTDKFNEIKEKFDTGEISAEKAKDYLISKRDLIKEKVDSGELSKESVVSFFNDTRDAIVEKLNTVKLSSEELFDEDESHLSDEVVAAAAEFNDKKEDVVEATSDKVEEVKEEIDTEKLSEEANKIAEKAKELTSEEW